MKAALLCLLLAGCATAPKPETCPDCLTMTREALVKAMTRAWENGWDTGRKEGWEKGVEGRVKSL